MKKTLFVGVVTLALCILFFPKKAYSQYQSVFGKSQTSWLLHTWGVTPEFITCIPDSMWASYQQDTVFQGKIFKTVFSEGSNSVPYVRGYVSEDTLTGKVFYREAGVDTNIYTVMDLSLLSTDSFYIDQGASGGLMVAVDSVYSYKGKKHIRLDYQVQIISGPPQTNSFVDYVIIEGVGTNVGGISIPGSGVLARQYKDSKKAHSPSLDSVFDCKIVTGIKEQPTPYAVNIFPNPVSESAYRIDLVKIELFDVKGKLVKVYSIKNVLKFGEIPNGVYLLKITEVNDQQISRKVIVQH